MADLRIDLAQLSTLQTRLGRLADQFDDAEQFGSDVTVAVGTVGDLPYRVGEFASAWNDTRNGLMENLRVLADAVQAIRETFEDLDALLTTEAEALVPEMPLFATPVFSDGGP